MRAAALPPCGKSRARDGSLPLRRMTAQRSNGHFEVGQQLYAVLEAIKEPEALWVKLTTGNYDWLGVRRNGRYVVGRPRLTPVHGDDGDPAPGRPVSAAPPRMPRPAAAATALGGLPDG
jgi:hypothetical protein